MVLWWLQGLPIDHKDGVCGHSVRNRLRVLYYKYGYMDRLGTTKVV